MIGLGLFGIEMNTAIWIGLIALIGIAEDDGVVIATYMEQLFARRPMRTVQDIREATVEAGRRRIRPCLMTAFTTFAALLPVMLATGRGADVARAMALPVFFGMFIELGVAVRRAGALLRLHGDETERLGPEHTPESRTMHLSLEDDACVMPRLFAGERSNSRFWSLLPACHVHVRGRERPIEIARGAAPDASPAASSCSGRQRSNPCRLRRWRYGSLSPLRRRWQDVCRARRLPVCACHVAGHAARAANCRDRLGDLRYRHRRQARKGRDGDVLAMRSADGGKTWTGPVAVNDAADLLARGCTQWPPVQADRCAACGLIFAIARQKSWRRFRRTAAAHGAKTCWFIDRPMAACANAAIPASHLRSRNDPRPVAELAAGLRDMYVASSPDGGKTFGKAAKLGTGTWPLKPARWTAERLPAMGETFVTALAT